MTTVEILLTIIAGGWGLGLCPLDEWASRERRETALWLRQRELWGKLNDRVDRTPPAQAESRYGPSWNDAGIVGAA